MFQRPAEITVIIGFTFQSAGLNSKMIRGPTPKTLGSLRFPRKSMTLPPSTAAAFDRNKMKTLLTKIVAKQLYGGFRRSKRLNSKLTVSLHDLLSVPTLERGVVEFLQKAKLHEAIDDHDELLRSHDLHFRAVSCVMCVGYSFNLDDAQLRRFLNVARRALRLMRRTIRSMVKARRRCILEVISEATQLRIHPDDFGPLECSADRRPALFNHRFFAVLDEAVKKKSRAVEPTS